MKWLEHFKEHPSAMDALLDDMAVYRQDLMEKIVGAVRAGVDVPFLVAGLDFIDHLRVQLQAEMSEQKAKAAYKGRRPQPRES